MKTGGELVKVRWGKNIRRYRRAAGLTQERLAAIVGIDQSTVSRLETGDFTVIDPDLVLRLAVALDQDPEHIFEWPPGIRDVAASRMAVPA